MENKKNRVTNQVSEKFQTRLLSIIEDRDCTKSELASQAKISYAVMSHMTIYGIIPTTVILIKLADYLDLPLAYLLGESDDKTFYKSESPMPFYMRLQQLKEERQTTYSKIAVVVNFPDSYFHGWIKHKSLPSIEFLRPIAKYFKVTMDYLVGRTNYKD